MNSGMPSATLLEWHSVEEVPPLHTVQYAGESWLQSKPLLLVNQVGKMAVGYCHQAEDGTTRFEVDVSSSTLRSICLWAVLRSPVED
jgi:hypothetical protein